MQGTRSPSDGASEGHGSLIREHNSLHRGLTTRPGRIAPGVLQEASNKTLEFMYAKCLDHTDMWKRKQLVHDLQNYSCIFQIQEKAITRNGRRAESEPCRTGSRRQLREERGRRQENHTGIAGSREFLTSAKDPSQCKWGHAEGKKYLGSYEKESVSKFVSNTFLRLTLIFTWSSCSKQEREQEPAKMRCDTAHSNPHWLSI